MLVHVGPDRQQAPLPAPGDLVSVAVSISKPATALAPARPVAGLGWSSIVARMLTSACEDSPDYRAPAPPAAPSVVLWQRSVEVTGDTYGSADVEGIVQSACDDRARLRLSADDVRESGQDITLTPEDGIDLTALTPGDAIDASVSIGDDGSYTLSGLSSDDQAAGADDSSLAQGDQAQG